MKLNKDDYMYTPSQNCINIDLGNIIGLKEYHFTPDNRYLEISYDYLKDMLNNFKINDKKCIIENCDKEQKWKGLCQSCYGQAKRLIDNKETTWEELSMLGLCIFNIDKPLLVAFKLKKQANDLPK